MAGVSSVSCAICYDSAEEREKWSVLLTCGHVFHSTCLESWLQSGDSNPCPTCRAPPKPWKNSKDKGRGVLHKQVFPAFGCDPCSRSPGPHTPGSTQPRTSAEDYNNQAEELRRELDKTKGALEEVSEELQEALKQLRKTEVEQEEQLQSFEGEKQTLKEEVATKRRELQKLREERHNMNTQYERTLASLRGQKLREEAAKKEAQRRLAQQELLLQKDLDAVGLSDLYRKLSAGSQDGIRSTDAAHVDAMNMRNKQYQMLHAKYQKLMAEKAAKSQLASRQATELHQLRGQVHELVERLKACGEPQAATPFGHVPNPAPKQGPVDGIPYDTPPDELMPMRLLDSLSLPTGAQPHRPSAGGAAQKESMVVLDGTEGADVDSVSAAAFAQHMLAGKRHLAQHQRKAAHELHRSSSRGELTREGQRKAQEEATAEVPGAEVVGAARSDDDMCAHVVGDSDEDDLALMLDGDEERQLLSKFEDTAVDMQQLPSIHALISSQHGLASPAASDEPASPGKENSILQNSTGMVAVGTQQQGAHPVAGRSGRKQLRRLCDTPSMQTRHQPTGAPEDEDADLLVDPFAICSQPRESSRGLAAAKQTAPAVELRVSQAVGSGSDDDVSLIEEASGSGQACKASMASGSRLSGAPPAKHERTGTAGLSSLASLGAGQCSNDSWDSRRWSGSASGQGPGGAGSLQQPTPSPESSQHRSCGQAVLPVSSRFASEVSSTGFTTGAGTFVGSRLPSLGGGTYVRSGADGRGGTLKLLAPDSRPKVKRQAPLSFRGKPCGRLAGSNKKGRSNAAQGTLPVTAYFK